MTTVYFGTNRRPNRKRKPDDFGSNFSDDGLANLRFGVAEVSGDRLENYQLEIAPERLRSDWERKIKDGPGSVLGSETVFRRVRQEMIDHSCDTVVFIHGYNVSFHQALTSAARLKQKLSEGQGGMHLNMVLFSWPSDGSMMPYVAYANDRQDALASGPAFARGLLKLADFLRGATPEQSCDQRIHLIAHSMGNYVLRHTVQHYIAQSQGRPARLFDQVLLMAADEDDDAFEHDNKLKPLPRLAKRVYVYFNSKDRAMAVSDKTKGNPDRLGDDGPRVPRGVPGKVSLIDCTPVVGGLVEHSYYLDTPIVVTDMQSVLAGTPSNEIDGRKYVQETNCYRLTPHNRAEI
ncbi:MAG: alpha/beta hydrolase [Proteobacteria bacterium]|nr:alpha/beta hydrolase [Pseudomonadota bacterium]MYJ95353.1 alpha/beta hydrolase [Pseudomonadota bacterium]